MRQERRRLTIADAVRQPAPGLEAPIKPAWVPGRSAVTYLQGPPGSLVRSLWWRDVDDDSPRELLPAAAAPASEEELPLQEVLRRQRQRTTGLGVTDYGWAAESDPPMLLVPVGGRLLVSEGGVPLRELSGARGALTATLSAAGDRVAFTRDGELWVVPTSEAGEPVRISHDAGEAVTNGVAEFVATEELGRAEGHWWSADGRQLAYAHVDERGVPPFVIPHWEDDPPWHEEHRYPFAGGPNALVTLRLADASGGGECDVELPMDDGSYLARVLAHPNGGFLVAVLRRDQRSLAWLRVASDGGARLAWVEEGDPWINLDDATRVLDDGRVLRVTDRSGFRHLELRAPQGRPDRRLTDGAWTVTGVTHVDEDRGEVWFVGTRDGVLERHVYVVSLSGGQPDRLSGEPGWHECVTAPDGSAWIDTHSSLSAPPSVVVRYRDGRAPVTIYEPPSGTADGLPPPDLLELLAADGETALHAVLHRPGRLTEDPPPLVVSVYGGPHSQRVADAWSVTVDMRAQLLANAGATVLLLDNRGTANRGVAFESAITGALGSVEIDDQVAAVRQLAERGETDPERVAIAGWSYGGFVAIGCLIGAPDVFHAAVAGAPVTEWRGYDTAYTERYLGMPQDQPERYATLSLLLRAAELRRPLLLVHGVLDENVHLRHTLRFLAAAGAAAGAVDLLLLPGERHGLRRQEALVLREQRVVRFLAEHLGLAMPPDGPATDDQAAS